MCSTGDARAVSWPPVTAGNEKELWKIMFSSSEEVSSLADAVQNSFAGLISFLRLQTRI